MASRQEKIDQALVAVGEAKANGDIHKTVALVRFLLEHKVEFITICAAMGFELLYQS